MIHFFLYSKAKLPINRVGIARSPNAWRVYKNVQLIQKLAKIYIIIPIQSKNSIFNNNPPNPDGNFCMLSFNLNILYINDIPAIQIIIV